MGEKIPTRREIDKTNFENERDVQAINTLTEAGLLIKMNDIELYQEKFSPQFAVLCRASHLVLLWISLTEMQYATHRLGISSRATIQALFTMKMWTTMQRGFIWIKI